MASDLGLRGRRKAQTRERIADAAVALFADQGYEAVSIADVAWAADVSDQTVYNYFAAKQELVLDRADEFRERYRRTVLERPEGQSPARALHPLVVEDIDRFRGGDPRAARGEFPALSVQSSVLRRFALEMRESQIDAVAEAILTTDPALDPLVARTHAAALVWVFHSVSDRIGSAVLAGTRPSTVATELIRSVDAALADLDRTFPHSTPGASS